MPQPPVDDPHRAVREEAGGGVRDARRRGAAHRHRDLDAATLEQRRGGPAEVPAEHRVERSPTVGELAAVDVDVPQDVMQHPLGDRRDGGGGIRPVLHQVVAQHVELGGEGGFDEPLGRVGVLVERRAVHPRRIGDLGDGEARDGPIRGERERRGVQAITAALLAGVHPTSGNLFDRCRLTHV